MSTYENVVVYRLIETTQSSVTSGSRARVLHSQGYCCFRVFFLP